MNVVVIGAQWGDEGKGKIVDCLAENAAVVVRYSGGANAGHTIVSGGQEYALHLIPSGALYPDKAVILGAGMVVDPAALFAEIDMFTRRGVSLKGRLFVSDRAHLVLPRYGRLDRERDAARKRPIGTTGRGIGTTYAMKSERDGVRLADLAWDDKLSSLEDEDRAFLNQYRDRLLAMSVDLAAYFAPNGPRAGANILFEGAQGALLDLDLGTYPYVSSGMSCAAGAAIGGCIGPKRLDSILGVFKAYSTRVGNGPFPSEFDESCEQESGLCRFVRETGREYGVTTGRPRRCGYLDLVALRYAARVNSLDALVMTHLDVYDTLDEVKVCVAYNIGGKEVSEFPASVEALSNAAPVLKTFPGWKRSISGERSFDALPPEARDYVAFIEEFCDKTPVGIVSVGKDRTQTFFRSDPWQSARRPAAR